MIKIFFLRAKLSAYLHAHLYVYTIYTKQRWHITSTGVLKFTTMTNDNNSRSDDSEVKDDNDNGMVEDETKHLKIKMMTAEKKR